MERVGEPRDHPLTGSIGGLFGLSLQVLPEPALAEMISMGPIPNMMEEQQSEIKVLRQEFGKLRKQGTR